MKVIIEHVEPKVSEWLFLEYRHSAQIWCKEILFTNVRTAYDAEKLKHLGAVESRRFFEIFDKNIIILDPKAEQVLSPGDFNKCDCLVIGGILGCELMGGRTKTLITDKAKKHSKNILLRNIGPVQFPIDQAALVAKRIHDGKMLSDLDIRDGVEIVLEEDNDEGEAFSRTVELPYGYVCEDGKIMFAPGFIGYLKKDWDIC